MNVLHLIQQLLYDCSELTYRAALFQRTFKTKLLDLGGVLDAE